MSVLFQTTTQVTPFQIKLSLCCPSSEALTDAKLHLKKNDLVAAETMQLQHMKTIVPSSMVTAMRKKKTRSNEDSS